ncbi:hypothetical protein LSH36_349g03009 [Paralvinella palmiformis]|uniref:Uncharacterized protein n=1 Tax=Paralvinella palmiformis TaxID=53620 RepID=A0AAD9JF52_9ANNE|nr:hypothetical protein LSH36_349g03009 [Paralvinella palmiformis]
MSDWICTYRQLCKDYPCDMRSSYCEQEKCFLCKGMCSKSRISDNRRLADCWNVCPHSVIALAILSALLLLAVIILVLKLKDLGWPQRVTDGIQHGASEDQQILPNGQEHSSINGATFNITPETAISMDRVIPAHPEQDDYHSAVDIQNRSIQAGSHAKMLTNAPSRERILK